MRRLFGSLALAAVAMLVLTLPALAIPPAIMPGAPPGPTPTPMSLPSAPAGGGLLGLLLGQLLTPENTHKLAIALVGALITQLVKLSRAKLTGFLPENNTPRARIFSAVLVLVLTLLVQAVGGGASADANGAAQVLVEAFFAWLVSFGVYHSALKPHNDAKQIELVVERPDIDAIAKQVSAQLAREGARWQ